MDDIQDLIKIFSPKKLWSWQTFFFCSVAFWILAVFASSNEREQNVLSLIGFALIIVSIWFFFQENPVFILGFRISNWLIGLFVCAFISIVMTGDISQAMWLAWPPVSAIIAAIPELVQPQFQLSVPSPLVRKKLLILLLSHLLISCWLQFGFIIDRWVTLNPRLLEQDFDRSAFVVKINY